MQRKGRDDDTYGTAFGGVFLLRGVSTDVSSLVLKNSILRENFAISDSGVIDNIGASVTATDCIFEKNESEKGNGGVMYSSDETTLERCRFDGNDARFSGGALYFDFDSRATITECEFHDNDSENGGGGVMYSDGVITLERCRFDGNDAGFWGGALLFDFDSRATITECEFHDNTSKFRGGAIYSRGKSLVLEGCILAKNEAERNGGAIRTFEVERSEIRECSFEENKAGSGGGAIAKFLGSTEIVGGTFECNEASEVGGAINSVGEFENDDGEIFFGEIEILDSEFTSNKASEGAGAIAYIGGPAFINGTVFQDNKSLDPSQLSDDIWDVEDSQDIQCGTGSGNCFCNAETSAMGISTNVLPTTCSGADKGPDCPGCHQSAPASCSDAMTRSGSDQDAVDVSSFTKDTDGTPVDIMSETKLRAQEEMEEMEAKYMAKRGGH